MSDPNTYRTREDMSPGANDVVMDGVMAGAFVLVGCYPGFTDTDSHATGTEIVQVAMFKPTVATALAKPHAIPADVRDFTVLDCNVPCSIGHYNSIDRIGRLARLKAFRRSNSAK